MRIVYLGYWGANEGLSQATINPHLEILAGMDRVNEIHYISIERNIGGSYLVPENPKIFHHPFHSRNLSFRLFTKILDIILLRNFLFKLIGENEIDLIICRSSLAGVFGYFANKKFNIRYIVESFEPHADYMLELGIWRKWGISYLIQSRWEQKQKRTASYLLPVSENYRVRLIEEGVPEKKIITVPCAVDIDKFQYNDSDRCVIRNQLNISPDTIVGIYVGKFGGLYMEEDAFMIFGKTFEYFENFFLIILTSHDHNELKRQLVDHKVPSKNVQILTVSHQDVPSYLSASDFAFSFHKSTRVSPYLSPIKNGEYWANGLPVLISDGIGDDSKIISEQKIGAIFDKDFNFVEEALLQIQELLKQKGRREKAVHVSLNFRNFDKLINAYSYVLINEYL